MSQPPDRPEARDLPDNVRRLVDEIENEIGDDGFADAIAPGLTLPPTAGHAADAAPADNGRIEAAVRADPHRDRRGPDAGRASPARRIASTACTWS